MRPSPLMPKHPLRFFFNDPATTEIYTLSLHDALPISRGIQDGAFSGRLEPARRCGRLGSGERSEEHTSELQSRRDLVCRLLLEKKKKLSSALHRQNRSLALAHVGAFHDHLVVHLPSGQ